MGYNAMVKHQLYATAVKYEHTRNGGEGYYVNDYKLDPVSKGYLEVVNRKIPKTHYVRHPELVDSINLYYKTEWVTEMEYWKLRNRWGKSCELIKRLIVK